MFELEQTQENITNVIECAARTITNVLKSLRERDIIKTNKTASTNGNHTLCYTLRYYKEETWARRVKPKIEIPSHFQIIK